MAFSSNFFDAYNTEKTNIRKRRKENAEMFEAYKDAKVADGEEVSVEELANMRNNLAGGDFYFGQALPAEAMMSELADRTNKRVRNTISDEFAQQAENVTKISSVVESIVPQLVSIDDYEGAAGQEKIKSIFANINPNDAGLGNQLYDSWKDRLPKMIEQGRDKEVNAFMLKNQTANRFEEVQHLTTGLPAWKTEAIKQAFLSKEKVFDNKNFNDALANVSLKTTPAEFTRMDKTDLDKFAQSYLLRSGVLLQDITPERLMAAKAALQPLYDAETRRYSEAQVDKFEAAVKADVALMGILADPAYDNDEIALSTINRHRTDAGLKEFTSVNDKEFVKLKNSYSGTALQIAIGKWETGNKEANKVATAAHDNAKAKTETLFATAMENLEDTDVNRVKQEIAKTLHQTYHIPPGKVGEVIDYISAQVSDNTPDTQQDKNALMMLIAAKFGFPTQGQSLAMYQNTARKNAGLGLKPNTTVQDMINIILKPLDVQVTQTIAMVTLGARDSDLAQNGSTVEDVKKKAIKEVEAYYKKLAVKIQLEKNTLDNDASVQAELQNLIKKRDSTIEEISNAVPNGKPSYLIKLRPGVFIVAQNPGVPLPSGVNAGDTYEYDSVNNKYQKVQGGSNNSNVQLNSKGHPKTNRSANGQILIIAKQNTVPKRKGNASEVAAWNARFLKYYFPNGNPRPQSYIDADVAHGRLP